MKQVLAMPLPPCNAKCAIHCATAIGFSKVDIISDFIVAEPFGSAIFFRAY
ncbi:hypothetical protein [Fibrobacter succinogenes]|uniref:hypothetical protein n=1 Tax=Fibrobacter succinogenes TaxID=833 RepID=UPI0013D3CA3E|nr:hypothetical protein [Fibrobacter succinogenes]